MGGGWALLPWMIMGLVERGWWVGGGWALLPWMIMGLVERG